MFMGTTCNPWPNAQGVSTRVVVQSSQGVSACMQVPERRCSESRVMTPSKQTLKVINKPVLQMKEKDLPTVSGAVSRSASVASEYRSCRMRWQPSIQICPPGSNMHCDSPQQPLHWAELSQKLGGVVLYALLHLLDIVNMASHQDEAHIL